MQKYPIKQLMPDDFYHLSSVLLYYTDEKDINNDPILVICFRELATELHLKLLHNRDKKRISFKKTELYVFVHALLNTSLESRSHEHFVRNRYLEILQKLLTIKN